MEILREYQENGYLVKEYSNERKTILLTEKTIIDFDVGEEESLITIPPTIEEQILAENQYQTALLEMQMMSGGKI